jgi:hypothetical protein
MDLTEDKIVVPRENDSSRVSLRFLGFACLSLMNSLMVDVPSFKSLGYLGIYIRLITIAREEHSVQSYRILKEIEASFRKHYCQT